MRIFLFLILVLIGLLFPLWMFLVGAFLYALMYTPYEMLVLAVCIDAQFGDLNQGVWFLYTLSASSILLVTILLKPTLRFYR